MRPHGDNGVVRAKFRRHLPSRAMGARVRVVSLFYLIVHLVHLFYRCCIPQEFDMFLSLTLKSLICSCHSTLYFMTLVFLFMIIIVTKV